jgi:hypothetical protein
VLEIFSIRKWKEMTCDFGFSVTAHAEAIFPWKCPLYLVSTIGHEVMLSPKTALWILETSRTLLY